MSDPKNIDSLFSRLPPDSLAALLVGASRSTATSEAREKALRAVLQRRLDDLLSKGVKNGEVQGT